MEFVVTQGRVKMNAIPSVDPEAPEGSVAGYMLEITDAASGIVFRMTMEHANAAALGEMLVEHTSAHPAHVAPEVQTFGVIPGGGGLDPGQALGPTRGRGGAS